MKNCKIIQDLLPNYIDGLTNEQTNLFIEEHIQNCNECKQILVEMKSNFEDIEIKNEKKVVDFLKIYRNKLKLLNIILVSILLVLMLAICVTTCRKIIIIKELNNKISQYEASDNYYTKVIQYSEDMIHVTEQFHKDEKYLSQVTTLSLQGEKTTVINYKNGDNINTYIERNGNKSVILNSNGILNSIPFNDWYEKFGIKNDFELLKKSIYFSITNEKCNKKNCYKITVKNNYDDNERIVYIEKETGLPVRDIYQAFLNNSYTNSVIEYKYNFGQVTNENIEEPDILEYDVIKE